MRPAIRLLQVDAFTAAPFAGNPAAVCLLDAPAEPAWMQAVAAEMNLSETAFPVPGGTHRWDLRWFTPTVEVALCGHATLATAHALWEEGRADPGASLRFATASGELRADRSGDLIELDLPAGLPVVADPPPGLLDALGVAAPVAVAYDGHAWLVEVASVAEVEALRPDMALLAAVGATITMVTAPGDDGAGADFVSRVFGPAIGIPEDPVTGAAHCTLGPWWAPRLGRTELVGRQLSARGGEVRVRLDGDRAVLGGRAVTVLRGELTS